MRASFAALALAMVTLVSAQAVITDSPDPICTITVTDYDTSTCASVSSYCPVCDQSSYLTTTYDHVFTTFCPTGLTVYTAPVTVAYPSGSTVTVNDCPPGYTTTVETCHTCGTTPVTATLVQPVKVATGTAATGTVASFTGAAVRENVGKAAAAVAVLGAMLL